ncbi:MAG: MATE family efflux transporter [Candidatus Syntrophonatronum acetioxidans]|uniref:Multidrug export protein MepA n=1 Tax=Candidatus Syntrophonatronum acetioxidans TaxID=1795816 RepID=A0A424YGG0_9FIRM|nr:MAG: MATE family efflux transporter [Candidatus Syntrophonatronum acetioxidans]
MKEQSEQLGKEHIPKLLLNLSLPATVGLLVMALYNVVDAIYIGWGVGTMGVAALSIAFPVQMLVTALGGAVGIGGGSAISRRLGSGERDRANQVLGNIISILLVISALGAITGLMFLTPMLYLFGSSETILPYARDYVGIILYGVIFFATIFTLNNVVRAEGNAKTAMFSMILSAGINIALTPVFIFILDLGIRGAAYATVLSQALGVIYLVYYFASGKSSLSFEFSYLVPRLNIINEILSIGASAFARQASLSIMLIVANNVLIVQGGDLGVAVFGIINRIMMLAIMPCMGIVQGVLPIVGFNYGAHQHQRVSEAILLGMKVSTIIVSVTFMAVMFFPNLLMSIFTGDGEVIEMGQTALRIIFILSFTVGIQLVSGAVFQAIGKARAAFILSVARQGLFLLPLLLLLPIGFQLKGVWLAFPMADLLAFLLALWYIRNHRDLFISGKEGDWACDIKGSDQAP